MKKLLPKVGILAIALLALPLASCGGSGSEGLSALNPFANDVIDVDCPPFGALKEAEALTRFRPGDGRDLTDVVIDARIGRVVGKCKVSQSKLLADVTAGVELFAERGPALEGDTAPIQYFVAIRNAAGNVVGRQGFELAFDFVEGAREARAVDYLTFQIPDATPEAMRGYRIFIGLQMTEDEWAFSQRARQAR